MALTAFFELEKEAHDSIRSQARIRIRVGFPVIALIALALCYFGPPHTEQELWNIALFFVLYTGYNIAALVCSARMRPLTPHQIVVVTAILDPLMLSAALSLLGASGQLLICFYLFTILGFGFRIGPVPMRICQVAAMIGFAAVVLDDRVWQDAPVTTVSNFILLFVVPAYAMLLIKKLRDARHHAEQENLAKSQLLANVSHELRTPLTGITSSAQLLKDEARDAAVTRRADTILLLARDLMLEIDNLLDSEKYAANALKIESSHFQLRDVMDQLRLTLEPVALAKGIGLSVAMDERIHGAVEGDAHYLLRVLLNIGGNAVKFTHQGKVDIGLRLVQDLPQAMVLRFSCADTGIGIPAQMHKRVFERFFQVSGGSMRKYGGTGLGMSIASEIVGLMGGKLSLESEPGRGSVFSFEVRLARSGDAFARQHQIEHAREHARRFVCEPACESADKPAGENAFDAAPCPATRIVRNKRILIADDNNTLLVLLKEMLERDGHQVFMARSGQDAIDLLTAIRFDVVLLDYNMGDIDGATVLQLYRFGKVLTAPAYILTADTTQATAGRLRGCGALGILHKPISSDGLRNAIHDALALPAGTPGKPAPALPVGAAAPALGRLAARSANGAGGRPGESGVDGRIDDGIDAHVDSGIDDYIDDRAIASLREISDEGDFLAQVLGVALDDMAQLSGRLQRAIEDLSPVALRDAAHALKGVSLSVGAILLAEFSGQCMMLDAPALHEQAPVLQDRLRRLMDGSVAALRGILRAAPPPVRAEAR